MPKSLENLWKFLEELGILRNLRKLRKRFKPVFEKLKRFYETSGKLRKQFKNVFQVSL